MHFQLSDTQLGSCLLQSETVSHRRTKRLRIESDEEDDGNYEQRQERRTSYNESYTRGDAGSNSPDAVVAAKKPKLIVRSPVGDEENGYDATMGSYDEPKDDEEDSHGEYEGRHGKKRRSPVSFSPSGTHSSPPPSTGVAGSSSDHAPPAGKARKMSMKAKYIASQASTSTPTSVSKKASSSKGKQKASHSGMNKRKRRQEEDEEEEEYQDFEELDVEEEEEEARFSDDYEEDEEDERPSRGKKGRGGGGRGGGGKVKEREREKEKDMAPILKKAKFEGNSTTLGSAAGTKRPRTKKPVGEDSLVDIVGDSGTPEPSSIGSPTANLTNEGTKDDNVSSSAPPLKKRKLPTIKKLKNSTSVGGSGGPSTPSSTTATGSKPPALPPPPPSGVAVNGVNKLGIVEGNKPTRPKTNATSDLDLSNPSLYAELFKNVSIHLISCLALVKGIDVR